MNPELFKTLFDFCPGWVTIKDCNGRFLYANRGFAESFHLDLESIIGQTDAELFESSVAEAFTENDRKGQGAESFLRLEERLEINGSERVFVSNRIPLRDSSGAIIALGSFFEDITDRIEFEKSLESARIKAEAANHAKSTFLANMSHEIRTPMTAMLGYAQILLREKRLEADQKKSVQTIESNGNHLLYLINDILDISKIEAGHMELNPQDFDLNGLVQGLATMFEYRCRQKGLSLKVQGNFEKRVLVRGDESKLRQVLINLLANAVKFTDHGSVTLALECKPDNVFAFKITDTGMGIDPQNRNAIFDPFRQGQEGITKGGTGLGLAISKKQLELMGTTLEVESEAGQGSSFAFTLQLSSAKGEVAKRRDRRKRVLHLAPGYHIKALVADDHEDIREVFCRILGQIGVEVFQARNGLEAVRHAEDVSLDIAFIDIRMPVMGGVEAIREIQRVSGDTKIVLVTASGLKHEQDQFHELNCDDFLLKPVRAERIFNCLQDLLNVEFEFEMSVPAPKPESEAEESVDFSGHTLSNETLQELLDVAQMGRVTRLDKLLEGLNESNPTDKKLIAYFKKASSEYQMEPIVQVLEDLTKA